MPIEIKELVVKFNVTDHSQNEKALPGKISYENGFYKKLVKDCAESVLRELERRKER